MFRLRRARDDDSEGVIALIERVYAEYEGCVLDVDREEPELRAPASRFERFWVVESQETEGADAILGCGACVRRSDHVEMKKIYLDARLRGAGWGKKLISLVEEWALEIQLPRIELWSDTRFVTAHAVYEHLGYRRSPHTRDLHDLSKTTEFHFSKVVG